MPIVNPMAVLPVKGIPMLVIVFVIGKTALGAVELLPKIGSNWTFLSCLSISNHCKLFVVMKDNGHKNWIYPYRISSIRAS